MKYGKCTEETILADFRKMKAQAKKRRAKSLLAQALLAVLAVALVFGNAYCVVKLVHGEAVFTLPSVREEEGGAPSAPGSGWCCGSAR